MTPIQNLRADWELRKRRERSAKQARENVRKARQGVQRTAARGVKLTAAEIKNREAGNRDVRRSYTTRVL